jgi:single-stranded DNA-specific DHH superfamily exonuclease
VNLFDDNDNDGAASTVILTGGIGDFGAAVSVDVSGAVNPDPMATSN